MQANKLQSIADSIVLPFKWLALIGLALVIGWGSGINIQSVVLIGIAGFWMLILTVLSILNKRMPYHSYTTVGVEAVLGLLITALVTYNLQLSAISLGRAAANPNRGDLFWLSGWSLHSDGNDCSGRDLSDSAVG
jgi:hypothetical protein